MLSCFTTYAKLASVTVAVSGISGYFGGQRALTSQGLS